MVWAAYRSTETFSNLRNGCSRVLWMKTPMAVREILQRHRIAVAVAFILMIGICVAVIASSEGDWNLSAVGKTFYSDDDGEELVSRRHLKGSPFDHNGKQAYRAIVFRCPNGPPFVAFLAKYSDHQISQDAADRRMHRRGRPRVCSGCPCKKSKSRGCRSG